MLGAEGPISGTSVDEWVIAAFVIAGAVVGITAAMSKPPFRQIRAAVGWVFAQLLGNPLGRWFRAQTTIAVTPIVETVVDERVKKALEPVRAQVGRLDRALRDHMAEESDTVQQTAENVAALRDEVQELARRSA